MQCIYTKTNKSKKYTNLHKKQGRSHSDTVFQYSLLKTSKQIAVRYFPFETPEQKTFPENSLISQTISAEKKT